MQTMKALSVVHTFFCIIVAFSQLGQAIQTLMTQPQIKMNESSTLNQSQQYNHTKLVGTCPYLVTIYTSCHSPYHAKDQIDIKFGDAYGTEVSARRVENIVIAEFKPCSKNGFRLNGKCMNKICKLLVKRKGRDGWIAEKVTVYDFNHPHTTFYYHYIIPDDGQGHGSNFCID